MGKDNDKTKTMTEVRAMMLAGITTRTTLGTARVIVRYHHPRTPPDPNKHDQ
ncbi:MAG: hypothetical protein ACRDQU_18865 [Pseudonocardiaceae bacterium]